jgi:hypothetical protein
MVAIPSGMASAVARAAETAGRESLRESGREKRPGKPRLAEPERRCLACGSVEPKAGLIRFVAGPDGQLVADLSGKLPGRGAWLGASRACLDKAVKKRLFGRALEQQVTLPDDLAGDLERGLRRRILELIGLCSRAGLALAGYEKARQALAEGSAGALIQASDAAPDGRDKVAKLARAVAPELEILAPAEAVALGRALGREQVVHLALLKGRLTEQVLDAARKLAGISPAAAPQERRVHQPRRPEKR